jgi:uncharacterized membrane protein YraQ (UPF0718 family)
MESILIAMFKTVSSTLLHNRVPLSLAILIAAFMKVYINPQKLKHLLLKKSKISILASVILGTFTPLCACGTSAVVIAMLTTTLPWGPIMAFLTSSPLMSPEGFVLLSGIIDPEFAIAMALSSLIIGLGSGYITDWIEQKTNFLKGQVRFSSQSKTGTCECSDLKLQELNLPSGCGEPIQNHQKNTGNMRLCCSVPEGYNIMVRELIPVYGRMPTLFIDPEILSGLFKKVRWRELIHAIIDPGIKQIVFYYSIFVAVGFFVSRLVPNSLIMALFSTRNAFAVPLAALIGLPLYISGESSIPIIQIMLESGASRGSMLAFLITGAGTSAWVIAGLASFLKKRVIGLYLLFLLVGGIILGYVYNLLTSLLR